MNAFLCYSSKDSAFVVEVAKYLKRNLSDVFYFEEHQKSNQSYLDEIFIKLEQAQTFIIFIGKNGLSKWQKNETNRVRSDENTLTEKASKNIYTVILPGYDEEKCSDHKIFGERIILRVNSNKTLTEEALHIAQSIVQNLKLRWVSDDDLPLNPHLFDYEKDIIKYFIRKKELADDPEKLAATTKEGREDEFKKLQEENDHILQKQIEGCPSQWPEVTCWNDTKSKNQIPEELRGPFRAKDAKVLAAALSNYYEADNSLTFLEAGPREYLSYPTTGQRDLNIGIVVSGGIAPGTNAVIDGITQRHLMYATAHGYEAHVYGFKNGFQAFEKPLESYCQLITAESISGTLIQNIPAGYLETSGYVSDGGSIIGTSRFDPLMNVEKRSDVLRQIVDRLRSFNIDILYVIGGDGSMKAAHAIWHYAKELQGKNLSVVAIPKTMDNDILWVWQSFGFLSAVERARELIQHLSTEVKSNPRLGVMQLFGSDSGFVVSHAVLASKTGVCDAALIPENKFSMSKLANYMKDRMCKRLNDEKNKTPYGFIVLAETAIPTDAENYINDPDIGLSEAEKNAVSEFERKRHASKRIEGQTDDALRSAGLKIVSRGLQKLLLGTPVGSLRVFTNEPRHLLRSTPPTSADIITAQRLGILAVDNALAGYTDFMVSQWLTEYVLIPLKLVTLGRKRIPSSGIFWKSVLAKTGQPSELV